MPDQSPWLPARSDSPLHGHALVVDDNPGVRRILERILACCGLSVTTARDAQEALRRFQNTPDIDVVLTDIDMPGGTGLQLASSLRSQGASIPIVFITGRPDAAVSFLATDDRAWCLAKPYAIAEVVELLRAVLAPPVSGSRAVPAPRGLPLDKPRR